MEVSGLNKSRQIQSGNWDNPNLMLPYLTSFKNFRVLKDLTQKVIERPLETTYPSPPLFFSAIEPSSAGTLFKNRRRE